MTKARDVLAQLHDAYKAHRNLFYKTRTNRAGHFYDSDDEADAAEMDDLLARSAWALGAVDLMRNAVASAQLALSRCLEHQRVAGIRVAETETALRLAEAALATASGKQASAGLSRSPMQTT